MVKVIDKDIMKRRMVNTYRNLAYKPIYFTVIAILLLFIYRMSSGYSDLNDGTRIDNSEQHRNELLAKWRAEKSEQTLYRAEQSEHKPYKTLEHVKKHRRLRKPEQEDDEIEKRRREHRRRARARLEQEEKDMQMAQGQNLFDRMLKKPQRNPRIQQMQVQNLLHGTHEEKQDPKDAEKYIAVYELKKTVNNDKYECVPFSPLPKLYLCVFKQHGDPASESLKYYGIWEEHIITKFMDLLKRQPQMGVIDLGAHVGQYALVAAAMGLKAVAVEPYQENINRFVTAAKMSNVTHNVILLKNAVSNRRSHGQLIITNSSTSFTSNQDTPCKKTQKCQEVDSIVMDDLLPFVKFSKAVLKIDITGTEHQAFTHVERLFGAIRIAYIFMEWIHMRSHYVTPEHESEDKARVQMLIDFLVVRGYRVFSLVSGRPLETAYWHGWPENIVWVHPGETWGNFH